MFSVAHDLHSEMVLYDRELEAYYRIRSGFE